ncbi:zinc finger CCCH domain-containing protein 62 isoform X2 [Rosa rugosa]|uniref:zinc finger CCCH domain-containing protein 62 isoform X2 n=1 Tax=Rosa rugosa TaxID=74645 RepID=UPI002B413A5F|nr:zinc finger CCCH domain-containing protein 62 isoform X2 [Rosa rugosa]
MAAREGKPAFICISSSEEEEDDDGPESDDYDYDENHEDDDDDQMEEEVDDESLSNKVIRFLEEGSDLDSLNLKECKAYLRKHGLRISGTKLICIQRIQEHQRLKDGNGEALYPRSSFVINCTGDVCKEDVVLFTQKVHQKFDKMTRHGRVLGKRVVAGRVVKESYGAAKQQHTFTVEVLWSRGIKELCPLFPLLVKGRNLYKMKTFRQRWSNEAERSTVLAEKHRRGGAARLVRAMKKSKKSTANGGTKCHNQSQFSKPNNKRKTTESERGKHARSARAAPSEQMSFQQNARSKTSQRSSKRHKAVHPNIDRVPTLQSQSNPRICHPSQIESQHRNAPFPYASHPIGSTSTVLRYPTATDATTSFTDRNYSHYGYIDPVYNRELNNRNQLSRSDAGRPFHLYMSAAGNYGHRGYRDLSFLI